jgi:iron complex outermembrane receptor protein
VFDVERVEVLKGPQGDLYGRNTTAGQINFISRKPTRDTQLGFDLDYSRFETVDAQGFLSGALSDRVQGRFAFDVTKSNEGWQRSLSRPGDTLGEKDVAALRTMFNFDLADATTLLVNLHWVKDRSDNQATTAFDGTDIGLPTAVARPSIGTPDFSLGDNRAANWTSAVVDPKRDNVLKGVAATFTRNFASASLTSITAYDKFTRTEGNDWDGSAIRDSGNVNDTDLSVFSQELRLSGGEEGLLSWIVGGYYAHDRMDENYHYFMEDSFYSLALGIRTLDTRYRQTTDSAAAFGHAEWQFAPQWKLVGGLRYTHEKRDFTGCTYDTGDGTLSFATNNIITPFLVIPAGLPAPGLIQAGDCAIYDDVVGSPTFGTYAVFTDGIESNKAMWKVALNWQPRADLLLFGGVSQGVKSGGFNGANANTHSQIVPYKPETLLAYEVGMKSSWFEHRMQLNASAFYYDYDDKQESDFFVTFVGAIGGIANVPKSKIKGVDFDLQIVPARGLSFALGGEYLDAQIDQWFSTDPTSLPGQPPILINQSGRPLANAPKWQLNSSASYSWSLGGALNATAEANYSYKGESFGAQPFNYVASYGLIDARVAVGSGNDRWRVSLWGKNLADKYYYTAAFLGGNGPFVRVVGMPRTYGIGFDYRQ